MCSEPLDKFRPEWSYAMKVNFTKSMLVALGLTCGTGLAAHAGEGYGSPSLLPIPAAGQSYDQVQQTAAFRRYEPQVVEGSPELAPAQGDEGNLPSPPMSAEPVSPYDAANSGAWAQDGGCADGSCGYGNDYGCGYGACGWYNPCQSWWVGANFLYMDRTDEDFNQISFDDTDLVGSVLNTDSAGMQWSPGFEIFAGKWFCGGAYGIEARYWGIYPDNQEDTVFATQLTGNLNTVFDFQPLNIGATNVNDLYDAADVHRVRRSWEFHNAEINWLQGYGFGHTAGCRSLDVGLIAGVRYFQFGEGFQYASSDNGAGFGIDPSNEAYYDIDVTNHLIGFQIGANASYNMGQRLRLRATPKVGVYGNHATHSQRIYNANGTAVVGPGNPLAGTAWDVSSEKDDVSFLAEIDLGLDYRVNCHWSLNIGYRALGVTGIALATQQIPRNFGDVPGAQDIDNGQSIILHGGYLGATYSW